MCHTHKQLLSKNEPDLGGCLKFQMSGQRKSISSQPVHNTEFNRELLLLGIVCRWASLIVFQYEVQNAITFQLCNIPT